MNAYHPKETLILDETIIHRERVLPLNALGHVTVRIGENVPPNKIVARGELQQDFRIVDVARLFDIDPYDEEKLAQILTVSTGDNVREGQPLANAKRRRDRKKVPLSPANGHVGLIENGRIFLQINPQEVVVRAKMPGNVTDTIGDRGVRIEARGVLLQCAWGNGQYAYSDIAFEPKEGLSSYLESDAVLDNVRGRVFVLNRPLALQDIHAAVELRLNGLVAPTMPYYLVPVATQVQFPILITDGFGKRRPTEKIFQQLHIHQRRGQVVFDAVLPARFRSDRPEIIIPLATGGTPSIPDRDARLKAGMTVRLKRKPYESHLAQITDLPDSPQAIDNGLRIFVARVKLEDGNEFAVPLENLELIGTN